MNALLRTGLLLFLTLVVVRADAPGPVIGIGTELTPSKGRALVAQIIPGSPADQAGVMRGDVIVRVDGVNVEKMSVGQVAHLLHGPNNSAVKITVNRGGGLKSFAMKRAILVIGGSPANP